MFLAQIIQCCGKTNNFPHYRLMACGHHCNKFCIRHLLRNTAKLTLVFQWHQNFKACPYQVNSNRESTLNSSQLDKGDALQ